MTRLRPKAACESCKFYPRVPYMELPRCANPKVVRRAGNASAKYARASELLCGPYGDLWEPAPEFVHKDKEKVNG